MKKKSRTKNKRSRFSFITENRNLFFSLVTGFMVIAFISMITDNLGFIGVILSGFLFRLFGIGAYAFPLISILTIIVLWRQHFEGRMRRNILYIIGLFVVFLVLMDIHAIESDTLSRHILEANTLSKSRTGPGMLGSLFGHYLGQLLGVLGVYLLAAIVVFLGVLSFLDIKMKDFFLKVFEGIQQGIAKVVQLIKNIWSSRNTKVKIPKEKPTHKPTMGEEIVGAIDVDSSDNKRYTITGYADGQNQSSRKQISMDDLKVPSTTITSNYVIPPLSILKNNETNQHQKDLVEIKQRAKAIEHTMSSFSIDSKVVHVSRGPTVTCYELQPASGVKVSRIVNLADDLALSLATSDIRIEAPIPGKSVVGIEVPNKFKDSVMLREIIESEDFVQNQSPLTLALGKSISGKPIISTIDKMPHLLIAGATGSGKSVCINTIITSILYKADPEEVKFIMIDPKVVELSIYNGIPHLVIPVVTDPRKASAALNWAVREMERRYQIFSENMVRDIKSYQKKCVGEDKERLPYIVIIIDELSDLMMVSAQEVEDHICRLAQMARACGIHLIVATQRPTVDVITGTIKANIPSRISFSVSSQIDSRTILDMSGAEKLLGKGDMLFFPSSFMKPLRVQGAFISDTEVEHIVEFIKQHMKPNYDESIIKDIDNTHQESINIEENDPLIKNAIDIVISDGQASVSQLQRKLKVGYARAGRIIDEMEALGIIGGHEGSKPRKVLKNYNMFDQENDYEYRE